MFDLPATTAGPLISEAWQKSVTKIFPDCFEEVNTAVKVISWNFYWKIEKDGGLKTASGCNLCFM